ncbi:MAG: trk system potassium uptake protein TrkH [Desulforhopalus sp.]|jgi:trk system potassium uptake protein TrkH
MIPEEKNQNHELLIFQTYVVLIAAGTVALKSPLVHHSHGVSFLDALFISTSAVCVTGLTTLPTSGFNLPGQIIILILIQVGAIGIMTFTASFILFFRGELDFKNRMMATQLSVSPNLTNIEGVLKTVVKVTLITETAGFLFLLIGFYLDGFSLPASIYYGQFHAISAFCNAGFSPFDSSLQNSNSMVQIVTMILIIMGGIGYYVVFDCLEYIKRKDRLTVHTKIVVTATVTCMVSGAAMLSLAEHGELSLLDALFQSITARTAGFNTIMIGDLKTASLLVLIVLMIIGAAPGSTGGGIKLTTFWVIGSMAYNTIRGREKLVFFGRCLPGKDVFHACTVGITYLLFLCVGVGFLLYFEEMDFLSTLFEMTSAIGTVGLSMGITPQLSAPGKIILIVAMLGGRIGPAVLVLMLLRAKKTSHVEYPVEKIILG